MTHPLVALILAKRSELAELEQSSKRLGLAVRQEIMRLSIYLGALEDAAGLTLAADDLVILIDDLRKDSDV